MGNRGFCRVRPVHMAGLVKRYRQLLGERRHVEIHYPIDSSRIGLLAAAISALGDAILICEPNINLFILRPIPFRFPSPLPGAALTRAILSALRGLSEGLATAKLSSIVIERHELSFADSDAERRFKNRIDKSLENLATRRIVQSTNDRWSV